MSSLGQSELTIQNSDWPHFRVSFVHAVIIKLAICAKRNDRYIEVQRAGLKSLLIYSTCMKAKKLIKQGRRKHCHNT